MMDKAMFLIMLFACMTIKVSAQVYEEPPREPCYFYNCKNETLGNILFEETQYKLTRETKLKLDSLAKVIILDTPCYKVRLNGYWTRLDECKQQLSWLRITSVREYLIQKNVPEYNIIFAYREEVNPNTVVLDITKDEGPNTVPALYPSIKKFDKKSCEKLHKHYQ